MPEKLILKGGEPKMRNPKSMVLTWRSIRGWETLTLSDINEWFTEYPVEEMPKTLLSVVRLFLKDAEKKGLNLRMNRYFDTVEYELIEKMRKREEMTEAVA